MILVLNEQDKVLLGKRKNAFFAGEYGIPSGHMEPGETFGQSAIREIAEETGVEAKERDLTLFAISNYVVQSWDYQYITFDFVLHTPSNSVTTKEPDKCEGWKWYDMDNLPAPLHYPAQRTIRQYQQYLIQKQIVVS